MIRYGEGTMYAVAAQDAVLMIDSRTPGAVVTALWEAVNAGERADSLLATLTTPFGADLSSIPPFALAAWSEERSLVKVCVRGALQATVAPPQEERITFNGQGVETWMELYVAAGSRVSFTTGSVGERVLPLQAGIVMAGALEGVFTAPRGDAAVRGAEAGEVPPKGRSEAEAGSNAEHNSHAQHSGDADAAVSERDAEQRAMREEAASVDTEFVAPPAPTSAFTAAPEGSEPPRSSVAPLGSDQSPPVARRFATWVVALSSGERVTIEGPTIVGRKPSTPAGPRGSAYRTVVVHSPNHDVSRNHLEMRVEGDSLVVIDLNSTNGTRLQRNGRSVRLRANDETLVVPGDVLDLGDGAYFTVEGTR